MSNQNAPASAREFAEKYINARSAKARKDVREAVAAKAAVSKRKRWANLLAAIDAGDNARIQAHAAQGEAKRQAWAATRSAEAPAKKPAAKKSTTRAKAPAKAPAKQASKPAAKPAAKSQPKAQAQAPTDGRTLAEQLMQMNDAEFASFFDALAQARKQ